MGIGRKLHNDMLDWYFEQTNSAIWLGTAPNTRAEKFYRKAGWEETGIHGKGEIKFGMTVANRKRNMNKKTFVILSTALFFVAIFTACKKENKSASNDNTTEASVHSDDQARCSSEVDAVATDADGALESSASFSGRLDQSHLDVVCDATLAYDS